MGMRCGLILSTDGSPVIPHDDTGCILPKGHVGPHLFLLEGGGLCYWEYVPEDDADCYCEWKPDNKIAQAQIEDIIFYCHYLNKSQGIGDDYHWRAMQHAKRMQRRQTTPGADLYLPWQFDGLQLVFQ